VRLLLARPVSGPAEASLRSYQPVRTALEIENRLRLSGFIVG
jgi:hypothetical protein